MNLSCRTSGAELHDLDLDSGFSYVTLKGRQQKKKTDKLDFIKIQYFKDHREGEEAACRMGEICAGPVSDEEQVSKIHNQLLQFNNRKTTQFLKNNKDLHFSVNSLFVTPWTAACQASLSITNSQSLLKLMSIESVMPSNHLILCRPLLLPPSIFPSIRVFSNKSVLGIRWSKYWSFSFSISPSDEYSGLISFRMDWLDHLTENNKHISAKSTPTPSLPVDFPIRVVIVQNFKTRHWIIW